MTARLRSVCSAVSPNCETEVIDVSSDETGEEWSVTGGSEPMTARPASSPASVPSSPASAPRAAVVPLHAPAATPGVSASASAEADSDDEALPLAKNWRNKRYRAKRRAEFLRAVNHRESRLRWLAGSNEYQRQSKRAYRACQLLDGLRALMRDG